MRSRNVATDAVTAVFGRAEEPVQLVLRVAPREEGESGTKVGNQNVLFFLNKCSHLWDLWDCIQGIRTNIYVNIFHICFVGIIINIFKI